ncbi:MAG: ComF family protein, partial [Haloechinothrix sp.]
MNGARTVLRGVVELLLPPRCAGCGAPGVACCDRCRAELSCVPVRRHPIAHGKAGPAVYALASYRGAPRRLVLAYKERGRRDLAPALGDALAGACAELAASCLSSDGVLWLVPVPSRRSASRSRGGPHMLR